jgi:hypothetical protein
LWHLKYKRAAGRSRTRRVKGVEEGGSKNRKKCKRCGQFGHIQKTFNETMYDSDAPPPEPPKPKRKRAKKQKEVITEEVATNTCTPLRLLHAPSSPFDLNCSPSALTRRN